MPDLRATIAEVRDDGRPRAVRCPGHDDHRASLSVGRGDEGRVLLMCHAGCETAAVLEAAGVTWADLMPPDMGRTRGDRRGRRVATYDYTDETGALLYQVCRFAPKAFRQRRPDGAGGWIWTLGPVRRVLFGLPTLKNQPVVYLPEGEKDVLALRALGVTATCNAGGAGKWRPDYTDQLRAAGVASVVVLPDHDTAGRAHAETVARMCRAAGLRVRVVALPDRPDTGDVSDWIAAGHTRAELDALVTATPEADAPPPPAEGPTRRLPKTPAGLRIALDALGVAYRYNLRAAQPELRQPDTGWVPVTDRHEADLIARIAARFDQAGTAGPLTFGRRGAWPDCFNALLCHADVDPFCAWLDARPAWDGVDRLRHWLVDLFEADENDPLVAWASQVVYLGAVWRTYQPGTKLDEMPVFIGPQGQGKSTALRLALPPAHPEWFSDGLHLADDPKVRAETLQGRVIVEAAEMAGTTRAELESLKSFLSRTDDGTVRLAYRRNPEPLPRRCLLVGTTNTDTPLPNDPTGNRRFVPVRLPGGDPARVADYLGRNRNHLWAEARTLYHDGVEAWLPRDLHPAQAEAADRHRRRDDLIEDAVARLDGDPQGATLARLAVQCGLIASETDATRLPMPVQHRLASALIGAGWTRRHTRHGNRWRPAVNPVNPLSPGVTTGGGGVSR